MNRTLGGGQPQFTMNSRHDSMGPEVGGRCDKFGVEHLVSANAGNAFAENQMERGIPGLSLVGYGRVLLPFVQIGGVGLPGHRGEKPVATRTSAASVKGKTDHAGMGQNQTDRPAKTRMQPWNRFSRYPLIDG